MTLRRILVLSLLVVALPTVAAATSMTVNGGNLNTLGAPPEALSGTVDLTGMLLDLNVYTAGYVTDLDATDLATSWFDADTLTVNSGQYGTLNGNPVRMTGSCDVLSDGLRCNFNMIGTTPSYRGTISGLTASGLTNGAAAIPEPLSTLLLGAGALIVGASVRRREQEI